MWFLGKKARPPIRTLIGEGTVLCGEIRFTEGLRILYRDNRGRTTGWEEVRRAFEAASGRRLSSFFAQWTARPGPGVAATGG